MFEVLGKNDAYVGHSINLYNRVCSYFMPFILNTKARYVLSYFNKYGFHDVRLTILIMESNATVEQAVELEQYFIDQKKFNLNVDVVARGSGMHYPMSDEIRLASREARGIRIYMYDFQTKNLVHYFDSKQYLYDILGIHHVTLDNCLINGSLWLDLFFSLLSQSRRLNRRNILLLMKSKI